MPRTDLICVQRGEPVVEASGNLWMGVMSKLMHLMDGCRVYSHLCPEAHFPQVSIEIFNKKVILHSSLRR